MQGKQGKLETIKAKQQWNYKRNPPQPGGPPQGGAGGYMCCWLVAWLVAWLLAGWFPVGFWLVAGWLLASWCALVGFLVGLLVGLLAGWLLRWLLIGWLLIWMCVEQVDYWYGWPFEQLTADVDHFFWVWGRSLGHWEHVFWTFDHQLVVEWPTGAPKGTAWAPELEL